MYKRKLIYLLVAALSAIMTSCSNSGNNHSNNYSQTMDSTYEKGQYGFDLQFLTKHIKPVELKNGNACLLIAPEYQGRVMTSSAQGNNGNSFGWINYSFIESGKKSTQFNPYGGEERLWIGPEGGPFSVYFKKGREQVFENWVVPKEIDTEPFEIVSQTSKSATFRKDFILVNASGTEMPVGIERKVSILAGSQVEQALNLKLDDSLSFVAYESENIPMNKGKTGWDKTSGALSIWMLAMFNPSENGVVFIPFKKGDEKSLGKKVTDDYFGKVPADRLIVKDSLLFFKVDGKHRSKIGISPLRALPYCGSYDPDKQTLTILWYSAPEKPAEYVNSKWGKQENPFVGDAVNSYNDGPVADGSIMGPFYEIESSSPAAFLAPGNTIVHKQRIFHISGSEAKLSLITEKLFNLTISEIKQAFNQK
ncbi:MAG: DUF6786 family protein [Bacteroidales bacterium]